MAKNVSRKGAQALRAANGSAAEIARHISAILNHPATPACIHNALAAAVCELYAPEGYYNSVEYITAHLANNITKAGRGIDYE